MINELYYPINFPCFLEKTGSVQIFLREYVLILSDSSYNLYNIYAMTLTIAYFLELYLSTVVPIA